MRAANRSKGGKAFIVLPSTAKNDTISRIVPVLSPGTHVSTSKNDINYVVTEYGIADMACYPWIRPERQGQDIDEFPNLKAYLARIGARPAYQRAMAKAEPGMTPMLT